MPKPRGGLVSTIDSPGLSSEANREVPGSHTTETLAGAKRAAENLADASSLIGQRPFDTDTSNGGRQPVLASLVTPTKSQPPAQGE